MYGGNVTFSDFVFNPNPYLIKIESKYEQGVFLSGVSGEGEFEGRGALNEYKKLKELFLSGEIAWLRIPGTVPLKARLESLELNEDARENRISYSFVFRETAEQDTGAPSISYIDVCEERSLWDVEKNYGTSVEDLLELNPKLSDPYDISRGVKIRIT